MPGSFADRHPAIAFRGDRMVCDTAFAARGTILPVARNPVKEPTLDVRSFRVAGNRGETPVIGILPGRILVEHLTAVILPWTVTSGRSRSPTWPESR